LKHPVISWLILGTAVLLVVFVPIKHKPEILNKERTFRVEAGDFAYTPAVLNVSPGDRVTIELISTDVVHGLYVDGYDLSITADPGQSAMLTFVADQSGVFRLRCSVTCGALHPFMLGKLQVGTNFIFLRGIGMTLVALLGILFFRQPKLATAS